MARGRTIPGCDFVTFSIILSLFPLSLFRPFCHFFHHCVTFPIIFSSQNHTKITPGGEVEVFSRTSGSWVKGTVVEKGEDTRLQGVEYYTRQGERMHKVLPIDSPDVALLSLLRTEAPPEGVNSVRRSGGADFEEMYAAANILDNDSKAATAASQLRAQKRPSAARLR